MTLYYLFTGRLPLPTGAVPIRKYRRSAPPHICELIAELLAGDSRRQPSFELMADELQRFRTARPQLPRITSSQRKQSDGSIPKNRLARNPDRNNYPGEVALFGGNGKLSRRVSSTNLGSERRVS